MREEVDAAVDRDDVDPTFGGGTSCVDSESTSAVLSVEGLGGDAEEGGRGEGARYMFENSGDIGLGNDWVVGEGK